VKDGKIKKKRIGPSAKGGGHIAHGRFVNQYDVYALRHNDDDQMLFIIL
jgi:hypothetical protein